MRGSIFAIFGGAFITLQGVANSRISQDIGTWQMATITQLTGFLVALLILIFIRDGKWKRFKQVYSYSSCRCYSYGSCSAICSVKPYLYHRQ